MRTWIVARGSARRQVQSVASVTLRCAMETHDQAQRSSRRDILASAAALGAAMATTALARTPAVADAQAAGDDDSPTRTTDVNASATPQTAVTDATIAEAEKLAGIAFTPAERAQIAKSVNAQVALFTQRAALAPQANSDAPAQVFRVLLPGESPRLRGSTIRSRL